MTPDELAGETTKSQAANHGYSHVSGIDITSKASKLRQRAFRPCRRFSGGGGCPGSPSSHWATLK